MPSSFAGSTSVAPYRVGSLIVALHLQSRDDDRGGASGAATGFRRKKLSQAKEADHWRRMPRTGIVRRQTRRAVGVDFRAAMSPYQQQLRVLIGLTRARSEGTTTTEDPCLKTDSGLLRHSSSLLLIFLGKRPQKPASLSPPRDTSGLPHGAVGKRQRRYRLHKASIRMNTTAVARVQPYCSQIPSHSGANCDANRLSTSAPGQRGVRVSIDSKSRRV
jgi:hypothetical protein